MKNAFLKDGLPLVTGSIQGIGLSIGTALAELSPAEILRLGVFGGKIHD